MRIEAAVKFFTFPERSFVRSLGYLVFVWPDFSRSKWDSMLMMMILCSGGYQNMDILGIWVVIGRILFFRVSMISSWAVGHRSGENVGNNNTKRGTDSMTCYERQQDPGSDVAAAVHVHPAQNEYIHTVGDKVGERRERREWVNWTQRFPSDGWWLMCCTGSCCFVLLRVVVC